MLKTHEREKLINAVVYFASNTAHCGKIKLIKLLYLLDFEHYRQTGRSVTGLDYSAWKLGPVPAAFFQEWEQWQSDFAEAIEIQPERVFDFDLLKVVPKAEFDDSHFTRRELRLMQQLAERFRDEFSKPLVNFTHDEKGPWSKIWESGRGFNRHIPYSLAIRDDDPHAEAVREYADEQASMRSVLGVMN
ncbi:type II toxin-antitoxin system antitoxin SocA domain-containing protein [Pseudomarimonas arenosa]|uniref:SocA family protein n=1 Tax=Pseudomarimonas arenosa TaxID=2774145 RepID=A0AAW3ZNZ1_9GAMM|nr:Panacea domain-containing protein [Pseudomarimonas arenosa]MBD8527836.1 SocA family protein [Pseudomarimonas arenosa]